METKHKVMLFGGLAAVVGLLAYKFRNKITTTARNMITGHYFSVEELCYSTTATQKGINNQPQSEEIRNNIQKLITNCLDPIREAYGSAIVVNSGYRCPELNKAVGGVSNSQHLTGLAADLRGSSNTPEQLEKIFEAALKCNNYDQLIFEQGPTAKWVHVSYNPNGNRKQLLSYKNGTYTTISASDWRKYI